MANFALLFSLIKLLVRLLVLLGPLSQSPSELKVMRTATQTLVDLGRQVHLPRRLRFESVAFRLDAEIVFYIHWPRLRRTLIYCIFLANSGSEKVLSIRM